MCSNLRQRAAVFKLGEAGERPAVHGQDGGRGAMPELGDASQRSAAV
jgi:hypothetical protein